MLNSSRNNMPEKALFMGFLLDLSSDKNDNPSVRRSYCKQTKLCAAISAVFGLWWLTSVYPQIKKRII